ncbi:site-specific DNA-methyltransferase [Mesorhizobium sp. B2-1-3A]|uniref:site-specific DNA-methyltransferase n=1 Tax=Mesorhizobium sp. B2-1-3A TaxID=2589971 RepID=UPI00112B7909|nr:site-specific DNA-methyltransferase [Mesorhizobium sp. B2-1-3A]TPM89844.1 site-specific DNA-methyltransferase [Mesorhizobium sp. B2-1-3A]
MSAIRREEIIGDCRLILGDCLRVLPLVGYAAVLSDPPYGIAYTSGHATDDLWSEQTIRNDQDTRVRDCALARINPEVPMLVFGSRKKEPPSGTKMVLVWDKGGALGMGDLSLPWKPSSEEIYVLGTGFVGTRDGSNVVYHPPVQSMAKNGRLHPNEKPVGLLAKLMRKLPDGVILDPFMGSGSCGEACMKAGRGFIGIEEDEKYFNIAVDRLTKVARQGDLFAGAAA